MRPRAAPACDTRRSRKWSGNGCALAALVFVSVAKAVDGVKMSPAAPKTEPASSPGRATILVVEDEVLIRAQLTDELGDEGYTVIEAADAAEALSVLGSNPRVDILFTDVRIPGALEGIALARLVRSQYPAVKVMATSGQMLEANVSKIFDGFFPKPCDITRLIAHLACLVDAKTTAPSRSR
jgi:two-component system, response regulator PdtaR